MRTLNRLVKLALFIAIFIGVVRFVDYTIRKSEEKASRRSEYAVIEQLKAREARDGDEGRVYSFREEQIRELHRHFHQLPEIQEIDEANQSQCLMCHGWVPHRKNEKIRVMMNMHTDFLNCETCHLKKDSHSLHYIWFDMGIDNEITRGPKFGVRYDPESGLLEGIDNHISKITPVRLSEGREDVVFMAQSHPEAAEYLRVEERLTKKEKEEAAKKFHGDIDKKGRECRNCHTKEGLIDFDSLGFSERRARELENLEIVGMFEKYDVFHLPNW